MTIRRLPTLLTALALLVLSAPAGFAQQPDSSEVKKRVIDTTELSLPPLHTDSTLVAPRDTTPAPQGNLERPAFTTARDSVIEDLEKNILYYFGNVTANYGDISITADYMAYNMDLNIVYARGQFDPVADSVVGRPVMKDKGGEYQMDEVYYNFTTRKAKIKNMSTKQQDGTLVGDNLKMMPDESFNISGGKYTVCDAPHPHYYLRMTTAKIMTEPKQKTMFGPAYLVVGDVPLPIGLPFGFVPDRPDRASGLLIPSYGDETARGLYLKDLGYSFVIGDYADIALTGDIYSYGSWAVRLTSRYKLRYKFDGSLSINYSDDITGERGTPSFNESRNFGVTWSHAQDSKAHPGTSFRASVNFSSPSNSRFNSTGITESLQNQTSSSISYSKTWSGMSLSINALHSQSSRDSSYAITFPNITFSVNRFYPFKRQNRVGKERIYEKISLSYNTTLQNKINFKTSEIHDPDFWNKMQNGMTHNFQIGLPSFTLLKYFQFSPSVTYGMNWFFREQVRNYDPDLDRVVSSYSNLFSTFGVTQNFSAGISMSTRLYGMFNFGPKSKLQAIRHMITPSFSFSWRPEMGTPANGYTSITYTKANGSTVTEEYNRYAGMLYSPPGKGRTAAISFSFANNLEAKIKSPKDSTAGGTKKVKLIDQLGVSGSYNFLADSLKLSTISISGATTVFGKLGVNGNMTLNPYAINEKGQIINKFNVLKTGHLARMTNAGASLSYSISGGGKYQGNDGHSGAPAGGGGDGDGHDHGHSHGGNSDYAFIYYHPITGEYIPGGWCYYMNPNIPWSLRIGYNYSFSRSYQYSNERLQVKNNHTQTVSLSGSLRLTKALDMNFNTGFDLTKLKMSTTQVSATYDLHCFTMSISWVPNGQWESWSFRFAAKASALADILKFKKTSSYWDK
ncbi:MAG: LPS-assembly protein LptD [Bacteroidales bacterium]|nr:LPS-assembly protein LptD [Bacteroidales bacterium]